MNKDRILALTDGIIAIAATIMVLELNIPSTLTIDSLLSLSPTFFAYLVSFILIYSSWRSHHNAFEKAEIINEKIFLINGIWIFFLTLLPFATGLIGNYPETPIAGMIYVLTVFLWTLTFQVLDIYIIKSNPDVVSDESMKTTNRVIIFGGYIIAFILSIEIPIMSFIIIGLSALVTTIKILLK